jgi:hypothetical protein
VPAGVGNMADNRPPSDVRLLGLKASLIARTDMDPALQYLLLDAATQIHSGADIFQKASQFPAPEAGDLAVSADALQYYKSGRPFLQRYLPFKLAHIAGKLLIVLVPLLGIVYPLLRFAPALYAWSIRRRVFRLYGELKLIEADLDTHTTDSAMLLSRLDHLEERADHLHVPLGFAQMSTHASHIRPAREASVARGGAAAAGDERPLKSRASVCQSAACRQAQDSRCAAARAGVARGESPLRKRGLARVPQAAHGHASIDYEDSVEEAICFGWVDSLIRRLDDDRYARKFTPRKSDSFWSDSNRKRYARIEALGLLATAGRERAPTADRYPAAANDRPRCPRTSRRRSDRTPRVGDIRAPHLPRPTFVRRLDRQCEARGDEGAARRKAIGLLAQVRSSVWCDCELAPAEGAATDAATRCRVRRRWRDRRSCPQRRAPNATHSGARSDSETRRRPLSRSPRDPSLTSCARSRRQRSRAR